MEKPYIDKIILSTNEQYTMAYLLPILQEKIGAKFGEFALQEYPGTEEAVITARSWSDVIIHIVSNEHTITLQAVDTFQGSDAMSIGAEAAVSDGCVAVYPLFSFYLSQLLFWR